MGEHDGAGGGSSPLARGAHGQGPCPVGADGLIPARAGSTDCRSSSGPPPRAHPRSRGEHIPLVNAKTGAQGSSPLARGALVGRQVLPVRRGLIPARAGSTRCPSIGDGCRKGSSPLARGARCMGGIDGVQTGLIPARAGSTERVSRRGCSGGAHPRSRGEHRYTPPEGVVARGSSPLARGAHLRIGPITSLLTHQPRRIIHFRGVDLVARTVATHAALDGQHSIQSVSGPPWRPGRPAVDVSSR